MRAALALSHKERAYGGRFAPWECARRAALARGGTLILAFSHEGLIGAGLAVWERGRPARNAALARGDTLILAFSHKGRRDPLTAICT